jgi:hypothetical protein
VKKWKAWWSFIETYANRMVGYQNTVNRSSFDSSSSGYSARRSYSGESQVKICGYVMPQIEK